jgi:NADH:ubiquinone reductase (non-electrogenic)
MCRDVSGITGENADFELGYDVLVMAVGSSTNTFNTPGVKENCFFVKELSDAARIRNAITDSIETACMPQQTEEERQRLLQFVVVGGGPTGVEFAAELHDFVEEDLSRLYPKRVVDDVKICLVQSADHILNTYDQNISNFTEKQFKRDGIHVVTNCRVTNVDEKELVIYDKKTKKKECLPYGLCVWATGVSLQPIAVELSKQIPEQTHRRALTTDGYLRVKGAEDSIFAIGDCSSVEQKQMVKEVDGLFAAADVNGDGQVTAEEFEKLLSECRWQYPQIAAYFSQSWDENIEKLFEKADQDGSCNLDLNEFRLALKEVDRELKSLPATAQVASQQGEYLGHLLNNLAKSKDSMVAESLGLLPFKYKHNGSMAYVGANHAVLELPLVGTLCGWWVMWLWRGAYANQLSSTRTKALVLLDWCKTAVFGRDTSRI